MQDTLTIAVRVQPKGSRSEITGVKDGTLRIKTTAVPADGKANQDVVRQLAQEFGVPKSSITLESGAKSRIKIFVVASPETRPRWLDQLDPPQP